MDISAKDLMRLHRYIDVALRCHYSDTFELQDWNLDDFIELRPSLVGHNQVDLSDPCHVNRFRARDNPDDIALDFGCGFGRWIQAFDPYFYRIDGCDISPFLVNITQQFVQRHNFNSTIYQVNYEQLEGIPDNTYDMIYSVTVFQHIPIHILRMSYFKEMLKKLKSKGHIAIHIGTGELFISQPERAQKADYYDNLFDVRWTNSKYDVEILDTNFLIKDLESLGYMNVEVVEEDQPYWSDRTEHFTTHRYDTIVKAFKP
jgi:SAM-dependent methyltransferase